MIVIVVGAVAMLGRGVLLAGASAQPVTHPDRNRFLGRRPRTRQSTGTSNGGQS